MGKEIMEAIELHHKYADLFNRMEYRLYNITESGIHVKDDYFQQIATGREVTETVFRNKKIIQKSCVIDGVVFYALFDRREVA